jgi:hypothetical protein
MIFPGRQKYVPTRKKSLVTPKQRARLRILAEIDKQRNGELPAFTDEEIDREERWLPYNEQNEINGWMYIAHAVRTTDLLTSKSYYEYQSLNNQMLLNLQSGDYEKKKIEIFQIENLLIKYADFVRNIYFLLLLNHLADDVYNEYEDLESVELFEMSLQNSTISWIGLTTPLSVIHEKIADSLVEGASVLYDLLAEKVKDSGIYLLSSKDDHLAWLEDKIYTILQDNLD